MNILRKTGLASAALAMAFLVGGTAQAADLLGPSMKDGPVRYAPPAPAAGPCYFRADTGYAFSVDPEARWWVAGETKVTQTSLENSWFVEGGVGCGTSGITGRGIRGELMLGYHGQRHFSGEPPVMVPLDPMHANIESYTMMVNAYFDLGTWGRITPYVGAGVGMAYNRVDKVYFTNNPALTGIISGDSDLSFAWSLMAGLSFRLTERAVLDVGYRYMDLGRAASGRADVTGTFVNPRAYFDDLGSHEIKVGLRYHFGGGNACCSAPTYVSVK